MKSKVYKAIVGCFALLVLVSILSACNRGVGCPQAFSEISSIVTSFK